MVHAMWVYLTTVEVVVVVATSCGIVCYFERVGSTVDLSLATTCFWAMKVIPNMTKGFARL